MEAFLVAVASFIPKVSTSKEHGKEQMKGYCMGIVMYLFI